MTDAVEQVEELEQTETPEAVETETAVEESEGAETDSQQEGEQEADPSESSTEKETQGIQRRIDELTRARREAERRAAYLEQQLQERSQPKADEPVKTLADFDFDDAAYAQYLFSETEKRSVAAAEKRLRDQQEQERIGKIDRDFESRESEYAKTAKDYLQVTRKEDLPFTRELLDVVKPSEEGPAVLYYLAKNPDMAYEIARMRPIDQAREIGRIEQRIISQRERQRVSTAPQPTPKIAATSPSSPISATSPDSDKLSMAEWLKRRNKQLERR